MYFNERMPYKLKPIVQTKTEFSGTSKVLLCSKLSLVLFASVFCKCTIIR